MSDKRDNQGLPGASFRLGEVEVHPDRLLIEHGEGPVRLEPRVMEMLLLLVGADGATVSRDELRERLWDAYVTDDAIHRAVFKLRRALGPHADLVETVPKRGYRVAETLRGQVEAGAGEGAVAAPGGAAAAAEPAKPSAVAAARRGASRAQRLAATAFLIAALVAVGAWVLRPGGPAARDAAEAATPADATMTFSPFTALSGYESHPSIDVQSNSVVFANFPKEGPDAFQWDLWRRPLDGGEPQRLTTTPQHELNPAVSPSGRRIAYARMDSGSCEVIVWDLDSGAQSALPGGCGVSRGPTDCCTEVAWVDEARLLVTRRDAADGPSRIYEIAWADGTQHLVTDPPAQWWGDTAMAVSRDATRLAVVRRRAPEIADLYLLPLAGGDARRLTTEGYPISGVTWSADDRALVFARNRTGTTALWRLDLDAGTVRPLPTVGMNASSPVAGAGVLLYEEWKSEINVWRLDVASGAMAPLLRSTRWDWRARPSPDGSRLAFVSNRAGAAEVWLAAPDGGNERRLTTLGSGVASVPVWSPDGKRLVFAAPAAGGLDILSVDAGDGSIETLVSDASDDREPVFSADGEYLFFASNRSGAWDIWRLHVDGGELVRWTTGGAAAARPAPDGESVWHVRDDAPGLWRQRAPEGPAELVDAGFQPAAPSDWVVRRDGIYYVRFDAAHGAWLTRFDPRSGEHHDLAALSGEGGIEEPFAGGGLWVAADGSRALLSSVDLSHSDLWIGR